MRSKKPDDKPSLDLSEIREIIELMNEHNLSVFHLERDGMTLELKKGIDMERMDFAPKALPERSGASTAAAEPAVIIPTVDPTKEITSPMVGTFYRSPSPESDSFVKVGDHVDEDTTVCIIEAMKVMNEIKAEIKGTIARTVAEDGSPVQYGETLFRVNPA
jgi:acetyl-CoA carboxylase biotin carboxyl carrier protein